MKLGDKLEWLFKITGIARIVKYFYPDCGCDKRKEMLNNYSFKRK